MKLKQFFTDDDAVSPVIGVILMVAITVILAAVIASFVLGLGQSTGNSTPSITFEADYDGSSTLTITATNVNDDVQAGDLYVRGTTDGSDSIDEDFANSGSALADTDLGDTSSKLTASQSIEIGVNDQYDIDIVWDPGSGDSSVLRTLTGPEA